MNNPVCYQEKKNKSLFISIPNIKCQALTVPEKIVTQIFNVNIQNRDRKKKWRNRSNKPYSQFHNTTTHSRKGSHV